MIVLWINRNNHATVVTWIYFAGQGACQCTGMPLLENHFRDDFLSMSKGRCFLKRGVLSEQRTRLSMQIWLENRPNSVEKWRFRSGVLDIRIVDPKIATCLFTVMWHDRKAGELENWIWGAVWESSKKGIWALPMMSNLTGKLLPRTICQEKCLSLKSAYNLPLGDMKMLIILKLTTNSEKPYKE